MITSFKSKLLKNMHTVKVNVKDVVTRQLPA